VLKTNLDLRENAMSNILSQLADNDGARKTNTRVGRGIGSGKGKTGGRGVKGQKSRSGVAINGFEGGQMPIHRRLPKRGFNSLNRREFEVINLTKLQAYIDEKRLDGKKIDQAALKAAGVLTGDKAGIKLLATGELKAKVTLEVDAASKAAIAAVEKAGGTVTITVKTPAAKTEKTAKKAASK
jgi:large subunit ribosomal protein L15